MVQSDLRFSLKHKITDESYTQGMVEEPILLLLAEQQRIAYGVIDRPRQKAVVLRDYRIVNEQPEASPYTEGFFSRILEDDEILRDIQPSQTIIGIHSLKHSLVPDPLFSKDHIEDTLALTCRLNTLDRFYADPIRSANAHMIYAAEEGFLSETGERFKEASLFHASSAFIESQLRINKHESEPVVSVLLRQQELDIVITQGGELRFFNIFPYQTSEDFIYYLLFSMEQQQLNPDVATVRCYGEIEKTGAHWMLARKYVRNVVLGEAAEHLHYSYGFDKLSPHSLFGLFTQYLCVL